MGKEIFREGDRVYHWRYGWGIMNEVIKKPNCNVSYYVKYDCKVMSIQDGISLSFVEYDLINGGLSHERPIKLEKEHQLEPFDRVLVRGSKSQNWTIDFFEMYDDEDQRYYCLAAPWEYCIPYEGNEHLLNTKNNEE